MSSGLYMGLQFLPGVGYYNSGPGTVVQDKSLCQLLCLTSQWVKPCFPLCHGGYRRSGESSQSSGLMQFYLLSLQVLAWMQGMEALSITTFLQCGMVAWYRVSCLKPDLNSLCNPPSGRYLSPCWDAWSWERGDKGFEHFIGFIFLISIIICFFFPVVVLEFSIYLYN